MFSLLRARTHVTHSPMSGEAERNIRFLYYEIVFAAVLSAFVQFNSTFIIRLGATKELNAVLIAFPPLVAALFSIPSARFLQRRKNRRAWLWGSLFAIRLGYGLIAFFPSVFIRDSHTWIVIWVILLNVPAILFTNGFQALLAELIPEDKRALVMSRRQVIWSVGMVITSVLAGLWLDQVPIAFPGNFQVMFIAGFFAVQGSTYFLHRLNIPEQPTDPAPTSMIPKFEQGPLNKPLQKMLLNMSVYMTALNLGGALFTPYYIDVLKAPNSWIGLNNAAANVGVILGYLLWERLLRRHNFTWALRRAALLTWLFPVGIALVPNLYFIMFINFVVNMIHPGVDLSVLNITMKLGTSETRTIAMSWYNTVLNGAMFVAPLIGTVLAGPFGIPGVFLLSGAGRILGGILYSVNPAEEPGSAPQR
jgi:MFS family permease